MTEKGVRLSIYIPEDLRAKFKLACTAKQVSMNQTLIDFIERWSEENDPFKQQAPVLVSTGARGVGEVKDESERSQ